jgi:phytoene synthase
MKNEIQSIDVAKPSATEVIQRCSRSFSLASRFLPHDLREKVEALYAWCRCVDDAVDQASDREQAERILNTLEEDLHRALRGLAVQHPASHWIRPLVAERAIDIRHAVELIDGVRMDLKGIRIDSIADLERYCYHVASTVGLMMTRLMGVHSRIADKHAAALGHAMQLTNIARDVLEDAQSGRSYLPGIPNPLLASKEQVRASVKKILLEAESHYRLASNGLRYLPWRCRFGIRIALTIYREIGREIIKRDCEVLHGRTTISRSRMAYVTMFAILESFAEDLRLATVCFKNTITQITKEMIMADTTKRDMSMDQSVLNQRSTPRQAWQVVYLGLSLTLIMAAALFVMVYVNPKSSDYSYLPLVYAGLSLLGGLVFNRMSARCETTEKATS